jgi:xanthine dehydrogenase accessory factor
MREILAELTAALDQGRACVYCSVIETRGSTPQKAGAAMLVFPDGSQRGTLGGGCVEAEVKQKALAVLTEGAGQSEVFSFCLDDNYGWDDGLICGGRMNILAEPLLAGNGQAASAYYRAFRDRVGEGKGCTEVVIGTNALGLPVGNRYLFDAAGTVVSQIGNGAVPEDVTSNLVPLSKRPGSATRQGIAYLPILPRITLFIVGGGHVGCAVAKLASEVDFNIWVLDDRERYASKERFPTAESRLVGEIGPILQQKANEITPSTYCLIVTRGHSHDEEALYHLATTQAGYVGMIGSRRKIKLIFEDLIAKGIPAEILERVHAPLGFEIGSQTVPEIAISIVAELIACRNLGSTEVPKRVPVQAGTTTTKDTKNTKEKDKHEL